MPIAMNPALLVNALASVFDTTSVNASPLLYANLCYGDFPSSVTAPLTVGTQSMSGSSTTYGLSVIDKASWSIPSKGVCMLLGGVSLPVVTTAGVNGKVPTFVRLGNTSVIATSFGIDASVDVIKGPGNFIIDRLDPAAGIPYSLKDARLKIRTRGAFSVNNTIANAILANLTGNASTVAGYGGNLYLGLPYVAKPDGSFLTSAILIEAFDGPVPLSANDDATGTKLWSKSISSVTGVNIFSIANNALSLQGDMAGTVIANGVPTYVRISKAAVTASLSGYTSCVYPKGVIQAPVGDGIDEVTFDKTNFVTGQTATLNSFTMIFYPNLS